MEVYQDLFITYEGELSLIINKISLNMSEGWIRDEESEHNQFGSKSSLDQYCFNMIKQDEEICKLWMIAREQRLEVTNIIPLNKKQLTILEYNSLLRNFAESNLNNLGMAYSITKDDISLSDILDQESVRNFYSFSSCANKSTSRSHPLDEKRWFEFIYSIIKTNQSITSKQLVFFLCEDGWEEQTAYELSLDMEYGFRSMLFALEQANEM